MNSHEILRTAIKLLGLVLVIYTAIEGLRYFPMMLDLIENSDGTIKATSHVAALTIPIVIGLILWLFPAPVANTIIKDDLKVHVGRNGSIIAPYVLFIVHPVQYALLIAPYVYYMGFIPVRRSRDSQVDSPIFRLALLV